MTDLNLYTAILGLTGRAGAGKDTVADMIGELVFERSEKTARVKKVACADPLKDICFEVFGTAFDVPREAFFGSQEHKEMPLETLPGWSGRKILQFIGTEGFRHVNNAVWSNLMIGRARRSLQVEGYRLVVVSDVRFLSEAHAIQKAGGIVVRVKRSTADVVASTHASELQLAEIREDYLIDNNGQELYLLRELVEALLCKLGL